MKLNLIILLMISNVINAGSQTLKRTNRYVAWSYHERNLNINGISVGLFSPGFVGDEDRNVISNGIKIEAVGLGILVPLIPRSPIATSEKEFQSAMSGPVSERINGLSLSASGTVCDCVTNGISAGTIGQINRQVNGASMSLLMNFAQKHNGVQIALFNESYAMSGFQIGFGNSGTRARGLQIGVFNNSDDLKGVQLGLWNTNQKRKMPFVNWNFN